MKHAIETYVDAIAVPTYSAAAVATRNVRSMAGPKRGWIAIAAGIAAVVLVAFSPAVVAQVQRVMQAFTIINGRQEQIPVREVSLEQVRGDVPFAVVTPMNVPAGLEREIDEIGAAGSSGAHAVFHYSRSEGPPVLTIDESSAADRSTADVITMRYRINRGGAGAPMPPALAPGADAQPGLHTSMVMVRNGVQTRLKVEPITWVARGTRITLIALPGALTRLQIDAIVRAMR